MKVHVVGRQVVIITSSIYQTVIITCVYTQKFLLA